MSKPLMPKATAVWLVENTSLTFEQIADFCGLHLLEIKGIADGDVAAGIKGMDPVSSGQLTREQLEAAQKDPKLRLKVTKTRTDVPQQKRKGPRYTPVSRRQDRPDAIMWLLRHHPELPDSQICKLVGTTKPTIQAVRDRTHWNTANLKPVDPVTLGLCTQIELDNAVQKAADKREKEMAHLRPADASGDVLRPVDETIGPAPEQAPDVDAGLGTVEDTTDAPGDIGAEIRHEPSPNETF